MNDTLRTQMETSNQSALSVQEAALMAGFSHTSSKEWCLLWDVLDSGKKRLVDYSQPLVVCTLLGQLWVVAG